MKKMLVIAIIIAAIVLLGIRVIIGRHTVSEASVVKASMLGISVQDHKDKGILVTAVHANSLAEQRGIQVNDVILVINDQSVESERDYQQILDNALMQKSIKFRIKRASEEINIRFLFILCSPIGLRNDLSQIGSHLPPCSQDCSAWPS